jgi:Domain of unknown function (DUF4129)
MTLAVTILTCLTYLTWARPWHEAGSLSGPGSCMVLAAAAARLNAAGQLAAGTAAAAAVADAPAAEAAPSPAGAASLARSILADRRFQRVVTHRAAAANAGEDARAGDAGSGGSTPAGEAGGWGLALPAAGGAAARGAALLFEVVLICVLLGLLGALIVGWLERRRRPAGDAEVALAAPAAGGTAAASGGLADADRLAAAGRHGEAIHVLLLVAIDRLSRRTARPPAASRTSRELVRLLPLEGAARDAFAALVALVEKTLFGGLGAAAGDFATAREKALAALSADAAAGSPGR